MDYEYVVIGAGVVGLAVAAELAPYGSLLVLEKEAKFGQGTSSRNSEVVHAGLYYRPASLKARLCLEGRELIEDLAARGAFGYRKIGKYIAAVDEREKQLLHEVFDNARICGAAELRWADAGELREQEPDLRAIAALFSPNTAVVDSHGMMNHFRMEAIESGTDLAYDAQVTGIGVLRSHKEIEGYAVRIADGTELTSRTVINCAGLYSDRVAEMAGIDVQESGLGLAWSRGVYYGITSASNLRIKHLVYPVPDAQRASLGVHVCVDLGGGIRFGPTAEYLKEKVEDYSPPQDGIAAVASGLQRFLPKVRADDLYPVMVGMRPKLSEQGQPARDFYICEEAERGLPGFVNLIGIESPGLTAAPAIAKYVARLLGAGSA